ncbi:MULTISPECIES: DUF3298 and DUF4163 domain-containing protein [unclassified Desulfovibrio]|uniref:DUF3298 and DUF4163 domain-containing protein n=1 Tax=unclassified Desulfovibrio TaxID=2593640 RepID=UPI000F5FA214|nr:MULTISPECIES: DUF3298 and DUF4163 domain-containing protein [unclassified Desulfovibrio]RRD69801.1 DUF3298/DUF4163 domain-containing protein [Desulfovibrio sp. OH1209_COT-279]RRD86412.1 DUF3298/DUF4163 domain-containing protein [Desulfovibrio sp. OH1186_COT-070]
MSRAFRFLAVFLLCASPIQAAYLASGPRNSAPAILFASSSGKGGSASALPANSAETPREAAAIIAGSHLPNIMEQQILRPGRGSMPEIHISYPSVGHTRIDADIRQWATSIADTFESAASFSHFLPEESPHHEIWSSYSVTEPSAEVLSITFEVWTYTGGAHGNLDIITLNYSLLTGRRLELVDIFEYPDTALELMSAWAYEELSRRLGGLRQERMLRDGLVPTPENFASLSLTPQGIRMRFQPYQVAPWAAGAQKVDMPLERLLPARPLLSLWGKKDAAPSGKQN